MRQESSVENLRQETLTEQHRLYQRIEPVVDQFNVGVEQLRIVAGQQIRGIIGEFIFLNRGMLPDRVSFSRSYDLFLDTLDISFGGYPTIADEDAVNKIWFESRKEITSSVLRALSTERYDRLRRGS